MGGTPGGTPGGIDGVGLEAYGVDEKGETGREGVGRGGSIVVCRGFLVLIGTREIIRRSDDIGTTCAHV